MESYDAFYDGARLPTRQTHSKKKKIIIVFRENILLNKSKKPNKSIKHFHKKQLPFFHDETHYWKSIGTRVPLTVNTPIVLSGFMD